MSNPAASSTFKRTLPLFDGTDRDVIQRLLHHTVEDFAYDHPDRKIARDLYHEVREGEAFRLVVGETVEDVVLSIDPELVDVPPSVIVDKLVSEMRSRDDEWIRVARQLDAWWGETDSRGEATIGFEYLH